MGKLHEGPEDRNKTLPTPKNYGHWANDPMNRNFKRDSKSSRITDPKKAGFGFSGAGAKKSQSADSRNKK